MYISTGKHLVQPGSLAFHVIKNIIVGKIFFKISCSDLTKQWGNQFNKKCIDSLNVPDKHCLEYYASKISTRAWSRYGYSTR